MSMKTKLGIKQADAIKRLNIGVKTSVLASLEIAREDYNKDSMADGGVEVSTSDFIEMVLTSFLADDKEHQTFLASKSGKQRYDVKRKELAGKKDPEQSAGEAAGND